MSEILLSCQDLGLSLPSIDGSGRRPMLQELSLQLKAGQCLAVVGQSGAGKTLLAQALSGLLPAGAKYLPESQLSIVGEQIDLSGTPQIPHLWGKKLGFVFQNPELSLNPVISIGRQLDEAIAVHQPLLPKQQRRALALKRLEEVGFAEGEQWWKAFPQMLSGGMAQRVGLAMALLHQPQVLVADEPTTALDLTIQKAAVRQFQRLLKAKGSGLLLISHDLDLVRTLADDVAVIYGGYLVEQQSVADFFTRPQHPYSQILTGLDWRAPADTPLPVLDSSLELGKLPQGCVYQASCSRKQVLCEKQRPAWMALGSGGYRCYHPLQGTLDADPKH